MYSGKKHIQVKYNFSKITAGSSYAEDLFKSIVRDADSNVTNNEKNLKIIQTTNNNITYNDKKRLKKQIL